MYFGMKSNDITKDRLEYYASRRPMTDGTHRDGRNGRWGFVPHLPPLRRTRFRLGLCRQSPWSKFHVPIVSGATKNNEERSLGSAPLDPFLFGVL
jgi:hypothetical protein